MLFNTEKPRFDSHLQSARLRPQRAAGASEPLAPATQQPESGVGCRHFDFGGSRVARMRRGGPRAAGQSVSEGARAGCCGSGAPLGTQSCAAGAHATTADRLPTRTFLLLNPAFVPY